MSYCTTKYIQIEVVIKQTNEKGWSDYKDILAGLQLSVVQKRNVVTESLRQFQNDFYGKHNIVPTNDLQYLKLCRKIT